jgi:hypothetical protein
VGKKKKGTDDFFPFIAGDIGAKQLTIGIFWFNIKT